MRLRGDHCGKCFAPKPMHTSPALLAFAFYATLLALSLILIASALRLLA